MLGISDIPDGAGSKWSRRLLKRFFVTPMTKAEGAHVDITIQLDLAVRCGLEFQRCLDIALNKGFQLGKELLDRIEVW